MRRSSSQGFYKFDNDESFHTGTGSVTKLNGSALKEKYACITPVLLFISIHKFFTNMYQIFNIPLNEPHQEVT